MIENMDRPNLDRIGRVVLGEPPLSRGIRFQRRHPTKPGEVMEIALLAATPVEVLICEASSS